MRQKEREREGQKLSCVLVVKLQNCYCYSEDRIVFSVVFSIHYLKMVTPRIRTSKPWLRPRYFVNCYLKITQPVPVSLLIFLSFSLPHPLWRKWQHSEVSEEAMQEQTRLMAMFFYYNYYYLLLLPTITYQLLRREAQHNAQCVNNQAVNNLGQRVR